MSRHSATESVASAKGFRPIALVDGISSLRAAIHSGQPEAIIGLDAGKNSIQALLTDGCYEQQSVRAYVELRKGESAASIPDTAKFRDRFGTTFECLIESSSHLPLLPDGRTDKEKLLESIANHGQRERKHSQNPTATEARLIGIWKDLLHLTSVGIDDDFFDLGGDSLRAIQLVGAIELMFGKQLAIATVFQAPTIRTLADALSEDAVQSQLCSVMPIKATGRRAPLFVVQSSTWDLIRYVDPEQPVYGLTYGVCAETSKHIHNLPPTLEELAADYVREMRTVQRRGPYFLVGHSAAGLVAYEMARQLTTLAEEAALVGLIDTHVPRDYYDAHAMKSRKGLSAFNRLPSILASALSWRTTRHHFRKLAMRMFEKPSEIPFTIRAKHLFDNYTPLPYHGKVSYWKCVKDGSMGEERHDELVWEQLAEAGLRLHVLDCRHDQVMKDPHVKILADQINQYAKSGEDD